ncbi:hypothetical protein AGMMS49992_26520 [Clostridia bacterium]|nr:hypothetical protein AGMMS49992_26520 [Clostridia bacterium]
MQQVGRHTGTLISIQALSGSECKKPQNSTAMRFESRDNRDSKKESGDARLIKMKEAECRTVFLS